MFYAIEGIDFAGKSSLITSLSNMTKEEKVIYGKTPYLNDIRKLLLHKNLPDITTTLIFLGDMYYVNDTLVEPNEDKLIIMDRWWPSTYSYQSVGANDPIGMRSLINYAIWKLKRVNRFFYLRIGIDTFIARSKGKESDRFENRGTDYYQSLIDLYDQLMISMNNVIILDGDEPISTNRDKVIDIMKKDGMDDYIRTT